MALCSNIGAYSFVFSASLAGLLWRGKSKRLIIYLSADNTNVGILQQKGIEVRSLDFIRYNTLPLVLTTAVALAVVVAEVRIIFPSG